MALDRAHAQEQRVGDLSVPLPRGDQVGDAGDGQGVEAAEVVGVDPGRGVAGGVQHPGDGVGDVYARLDDPGSIAELRHRWSQASRERLGLSRQQWHRPATVELLRGLNEEEPFAMEALPGTVFHAALRQQREEREPHVRTQDRLHLAAIEELGVPALFHSGQTGIGAGLPGGGGIRLKYSNPMELDDVAVDFPGLTIICAHPSVPWQDEALAVATHKPNVYIDLSGWSPKYFSPTLVQYANSLLKHKVLFGSDYPMLTPDRWLADFEKVAFKDEVRPLILKENAVRLFGLA